MAKTWPNTTMGIHSGRMAELDSIWVSDCSSAGERPEPPAPEPEPDEVADMAVRC